MDILVMVLRYDFTALINDSTIRTLTAVMSGSCISVSESCQPNSVEDQAYAE